MKCFNHNTDAVGICKHCQRAICKECCTDLGHGLACKASHEGEVEALYNLIQNNKRAYESQPKATLFAPLFYIFMGLAFLYFGYPKGFDSFAFVIGAGFIVFGVIIYIYNKIYFNKVITKYET